MSYYDTSYPPSLWEEPAPPVVPSTGATAGVPGTWTPPGSTPPANVTALVAGVPNAVVASPLTAWTTGQHVLCANNAQAYWNGTAWIAGAPALEEQQTEEPPMTPEPDLPPEEPPTEPPEEPTP